MTSRPEDEPQVEEKPIKGEEIEGLILLFTIAYRPTDNHLSFVGNMPVTQAMGLIQEILVSQGREKMRKDIIAELKKKAEKPTKVAKKEGK